MDLSTQRALTVPEELARACVRMTHPVWTQVNGEPLEQAFVRIFGKALPESLVVAAVLVDEKWCTAHLIPGGIVCLWHPVTGWQIRTLTAEGRRANDRVANVAAELTRADTKQRAALVYGAPTHHELASYGRDWLRRAS